MISSLHLSCFDVADLCCKEVPDRVPSHPLDEVCVIGKDPDFVCRQHLIYRWVGPLTKRLTIPYENLLVQSDRGQHGVIPGPSDVDDIWKSVVRGGEGRGGVKAERGG